jgi:hypothetical protein
MGPGRVLYADDQLADHPLWERPVVAADTPLRVGAQQRVGSFTAGCVIAQGDAFRPDCDPTVWGRLRLDATSGAITVRDTRTGAVVAAQPVPPHFSGSPQLRGDWVLAPHSGAVNIWTGRYVALPSAAHAFDPVLGDGVVAGLQVAADGTVHVAVLYLDEPDLGFLDVGVVDEETGRDTVAARFALDDRLVAWADPGGRVHIHRLARAVAQPARSLDSSWTQTASPRAATWELRSDATKPLRSWRLEIRDTADRLVRAAYGTAPFGTAHYSWDGHDARGNRAAVGAYRWRLNGFAADGTGALADVSGRELGDHGSVLVRLAGR